MRIQVQCDNEVSLTVINSGRTRDWFFQWCLRELAFIAAHFEFEIRAVHIRGVDNRILDYLSRWSLHKDYEDRLWRSVGREPTTETYSYPGLFNFTHNW